MNIIIDHQIVILFASFIAILSLASGFSWILEWRCKKATGNPSATVANLRHRVRAWWIMIAVLGIAAISGSSGMILLFGIISFMALREFLTIITTRRGDHRSLFWSFFFFVPLQYYFIHIHWYGMMSIFIPVYGFIFLSIRSALSGDPNKYLERISVIQTSLMICVYSISHVPGLLLIPLRSPESNLKQLFFLLIVVQSSDILQYVFGKCLGKHPISPNISPNKTWEGLIGGGVCATGIGFLLSPITVFAKWEAPLVAAGLVLLGFFGGIVMSAIKRDLGVKDYGTSIPGHGGIMDRMDSLCLSAPIYFHFIRFFHSS